VGLAPAEITQAAWTGPFWHCIMQTCWTFNSLASGVARGMTRHYLLLLLAHLPCAKSSAAACVYVERSPPPVHLDRDAVWDWACELSNAVSPFSIASADDATLLWNARFSRSRGPAVALHAGPLVDGDALVEEFIAYATAVGAEVAAALRPRDAEESL
jgi:hypothetical protein